MDHFNYYNNNTDSTLSIVHYDIQDIDDNQMGDNEKFGDELLIDLIRSRSYLW